MRQAARALDRVLVERGDEDGSTVAGGNSAAHLATGDGLVVTQLACAAGHVLHGRRMKRWLGIDFSGAHRQGLLPLRRTTESV